MDADRLRNAPLFDTLPDGVRERFAVWVGELKVDAGRVLAEEGEYAYELFVIEDGTAEVSRDGEVIAELGPGEFFGEMGVLTGEQRNATVTARTRMTLLTLSTWDTTRLRRQAPDAIQQLREVIEQRRAAAG